MLAPQARFCSFAEDSERGDLAMRAWGRLVFAAAAVLLLPGCLWSPGKFTSELALRKGGAFVLDYRGEILFQLPDDKDRQPEAWSDSMAVCRVGRPPEL